jgi:hypothetical protein
MWGFNILAFKLAKFYIKHATEFYNGKMNKAKSITKILTLYLGLS